MERSRGANGSDDVHGARWKDLALVLCCLMVGVVVGIGLATSTHRRPRTLNRRARPPVLEDAEVMEAAIPETIPQATQPPTHPSSFQRTETMEKGGEGGNRIPCAMPKLSKSTFCADNDVRRWQEAKADIEWAGNGGHLRGLILGPEAVVEASISPTWMCDKLPENLDAWQEPSRLVPSDLAVGVFSGTSLLYSRANAMLDSWLHRIEKRRIYDRVAEPTTPITTLRTRFKEWLAPVEKQNAEVLAMFGLQELYEDFPDAKWYFIIGDDTYLNIDYALRALERFDETQPLWVSYGGGYPHPLSKHGMENFTLEQWPRWRAVGGDSGTTRDHFVWTSGAQSFFLSNSIVKDFAEHLDRFCETFSKSRTGGNRPDVMTGALLTMLGYKPESLYTTSDCVNAYAVDGTNTKVDCLEWSCYHYVQPRRMLAIDQRAQHEKLDRLQNAGNAEGIVKMFHQFLDEHYATLRRKQTQIAYLAQKANIPVKVYDIPVPDDSATRE